MLLGKLDGKLYVIKSRLAKSLNAEFIDWYVQMLESVGDSLPVYCYMENNKLQDPFFQQVFRPLSPKFGKRGAYSCISVLTSAKRLTRRPV